MIFQSIIKKAKSEKDKHYRLRRNKYTKSSFPVLDTKVDVICCNSRTLCLGKDRIPHFIYLYLFIIYTYLFLIYNPHFLIPYLSYSLFPYSLFIRFLIPYLFLIYVPYFLIPYLFDSLFLIYSLFHSSVPD